MVRTGPWPCCCAFVDPASEHEPPQAVCVWGGMHAMLILMWVSCRTLAWDC